MSIGVSHARITLRVDEAVIKNWGGWKTKRWESYSREVLYSRFWEDFYFWLATNYHGEVNFGEIGHDD